jgi:hypothetical protein
VEALAGGDARAEILMVVAGQALVVRQLLAVTDVAVGAAVLVIERAVALPKKSSAAALPGQTADDQTANSTASAIGATAPPTKRFMRDTLPSTRP